TAAPGVARRRFLVAAGGTAALALVAGVGGWLLTGREGLARVRAAIRLPRPVRPAGPVPPGADLEVPGLTPLFIPNERFYRIDTALRVPIVDPATWQLEIRGLVDRPYTLTYADLMEMPQIEADITLACVSNPVGGDLVGNARWQGVSLRALLERAGLQEGAVQLIGRSVDGFTAGFPTITALDLEEAMVAVGMNGEPLPAEHGFPARLVVPGLYGYVSATKWLSAIELTTWDVDGYWIPRGWAKEGPIKTQSRIDVPTRGTAVPAGPTPIAGVAWAPTRGIERVEVRIDDGPWQEAELAAPYDVDVWRQWVLPWDATPGVHRIAARATDGAGEVQTDQRTPVAPDGASGYPVIEVLVEPV
ncbi:molybdopterin-binding oxidoreductase, partial [Geodermatophilus sp. DF01-2]|uniref:molybdopterin-dependent oxidoreductase n=1 Tax=Geodermatophilus sp. DF01-2 TaxID=2559610 RepID=UPI0011028E11